MSARRPSSARRAAPVQYDLTRAIAQVAGRKPIISVMSGLPVFGGFNPMMMRSRRRAD
jgi:hypothetical protein